MLRKPLVRTSLAWLIGAVALTTTSYGGRPYGRMWSGYKPIVRTANLSLLGDKIVVSVEADWSAGGIEMDTIMVEAFNGDPSEDDTEPTLTTQQEGPRRAFGGFTLPLHIFVIPPPGKKVMNGVTYDGSYVMVPGFLNGTANYPNLLVNLATKPPSPSGPYRVYLRVVGFKNFNVVWKKTYAGWVNVP